MFACDALVRWWQRPLASFEPCVSFSPLVKEFFMKFLCSRFSLKRARRAVVLAVAIYCVFANVDLSHAGSIIAVSSNGSFSNPATGSFGNTGLSSDTADPGGLQFNKANALGITGLSISSTLTSDFPGGATSANTQTTVTSIKYNDTKKASNATITLYLMVGIDGFTSPTANPLELMATLGINNAAGASVTSQSWVNGVATATNPDGTANGAPGTSWQTGTTTGTVNPSNNVWSSPQQYTGGTPFSIYTLFEVTLVNNNVALTVSSQTQVANAPEPATMTLLGMGLVGMGGYAWRRRRQQQAAATTVA
jgi:hypothetical protein